MRSNQFWSFKFSKSDNWSSPSIFPVSMNQNQSDPIFKILKNPYFIFKRLKNRPIF